MIAMPEIFRTRDVIVFKQGLTYTVAADSAMLAAGWAGGQGLMWKESTKDEFLTTSTDGVRGAGFALWGSDEDSDKLTAITGQQASYGYVVLCCGSWIISTRTFEQYTLASRLSPPLVALTYNPSDQLYWSLDGRFTKEDEWAISGDPRAPNPYPVGYVAQTPAQANGFLSIQTTL